MTALQWIIKEAKILRKKSPKMEWKKAVAQASAIYASKHKGKSPVGKKHAKKVVRKKAAKKKIGYSKIRYKQEKGITKVLKSTPKTLFPYTREEKLIKAGKKYYDNAAKGLSGTKIKKKVARKKATPESLHKDTKSHNVNIKVMSGLGKFSHETLAKISKQVKDLESLEGKVRMYTLFKKSANYKNPSSQKIINSYIKKAKDQIKETKTHITQLKKHI